MSTICLENISKVYGEKDARFTALHDVTLRIEQGEMVAIMGASGSGKSTLLNIIGCLDRLTEGVYYIDGNDISHLNERQLARLRGEHFGFIVQNYALIESYTVYQNVLLPTKYSKKTPRSKRSLAVKDMIAQFNLSEKEKAYPSQLSGGQCQRVAIARALINNPEIILADEPTGALDSKTGDECMDILSQLHKQGKTIVIVTHDLHVANRCNRIINIKDGTLV